MMTQSPWAMAEVGEHRVHAIETGAGHEPDIELRDFQGLDERSLIELGEIGATRQRELIDQWLDCGVERRLKLRRDRRPFRNGRV